MQKKRKPKPKPGPVVVQSATVTVPPHELATAVARCPAKTRAVGGGFAAAPGGTEQTQVTESRLADPVSWTVSAIRSAPLTTSSGTVTATVHCRRNAPRAFPVTASVTLPAATAPGAVSTGSATATCVGRRLKAVAGGFATQVDTVTTLGVVPQESRRAKGGRSWQVSAVHNNISPRTATAYAYCARAKVSQKTAQISMTGDLSTEPADAGGCPRGRRPVSGGFLTSGASLAGGGNIVFVLESRLHGPAWRSTGLHAGPVSTGTLRSYLYCS